MNDGSDEVIVQPQKTKTPALRRGVLRLTKLTDYWFWIEGWQLLALEKRIVGFVKVPSVFNRPS